MKRSAISDKRFVAWTLTTVFLVLTVASAYGQASPSGTGERPPSEIEGAFPATLSKSLDSKKLKEGETVICLTAVAMHAHSGFLIPSGAKVIGHVTQAQARSKGDAQSSLGIVFDKIEISKNEDIPIKGVLQAVGPNLGDSGPSTSAGPPSLGGSGSRSIGGSGSGGTTATPMSGTYGGTGGPTATRILTRDSKGVIGIHNIEMNDQNVLTSTGKEIKLDSGSQIMIRAEADAPPAH